MVPPNHHFLPKKAHNFAREICPSYKNVTVQYYKFPPPRAGMHQHRSMYNHVFLGAALMVSLRGQTSNRK
jgi:hypothetical protein